MFEQYSLRGRVIRVTRRLVVLIQWPKAGIYPFKGTLKQPYLLLLSNVYGAKTRISNWFKLPWFKTNTCQGGYRNRCLWGIKNPIELALEQSNCYCWTIVIIWVVTIQKNSTIGAKITKWSIKYKIQINQNRTQANTCYVCMSGVIRFSRNSVSGNRQLIHRRQEFRWKIKCEQKISLSDQGLRGNFFSRNVLKK